MIIIPKIFTTVPTENGPEPACYPARQLTAEEKANVIAIWGDEENYIYFEKGDEQHPKYQKLILIQSQSQP